MNETQRLAWIEAIKRVTVVGHEWNAHDVTAIEELVGWLESSEARCAVMASEYSKLIYPNNTK